MTTDDGHPYFDNPCPACDAPSKSRCRSTNGRVTSTHRERIAFWWEQEGPEQDAVGRYTDPRMRGLLDAEYGVDDAAMTLADVDAADRAAGVVRVDTRNPDPALSSEELVDLYWTTSGDDWAIPDWLMVKFGRAVIGRYLAALAAPEDTP